MKSPTSIFLLLFSLIATLSACSSSSIGSNIDERILGTWEFSDVEFRPKGNVFSLDYTKGFKGSTVTFKEGGILEAYDKDLDTIATGYWYIDFYEEYDEASESNTTVYYLAGTLDIPELSIFTDLYWDDLTVTGKKLYAIEEKDTGKYTYKMQR
jgi:hypothetical protein